MSRFMMQGLLSGFRMFWMFLLHTLGDYPYVKSLTHRHQLWISIAASPYFPKLRPSNQDQVDTVTVVFAYILSSTGVCVTKERS